MERSPQMHPHLTRAGAAALLLATVVLHMQAGVVRPAPAAPAAGGGDAMHHLHFFMHDGYTGPSPTAVVVVNGTVPVFPGVRFGDTVVMDDVLTEGPSRASRTVGRAQGTYVTSSLEKGHPALMLAMSVVLTDYDGYTGSTVLVMGRNEIMEHVRELSVVGGTGRFRMATGYVLWKTASMQGQNAVLELDVFLRA